MAVLENILNFVLNVTIQEWKKMYNEHAIGIAKYDEGNAKFKTIMKNLNLDLVREN